MKSTTRTIALATMVACGIALAPQAAGAQASPPNVVCRGALGAVMVDNLEIPARATCTLTGTTVLGSIHVEQLGRLDATSVTISGNVEAQGSRAVAVLTSITETGAPPGRTRLRSCSTMQRQPLRSLRRLDRCAANGDLGPAGDDPLNQPGHVTHGPPLADHPR